MYIYLLHFRLIRCSAAGLIVIERIPVDTVATALQLPAAARYSGSMRIYYPLHIREPIGVHVSRRDVGRLDVSYAAAGYGCRLLVRNDLHAVKGKDYVGRCPSLF